MAEQSMLAAVSGIDANQTYLDSIANNIANADTIGYKSQDVQFSDLLSEQISGGSSPSANQGGANPIAVGAGTRVASSAMNLSEGSLEATGQPTDVAIQGSGYLVVINNGQQSFTRDGNLTVDANGNLTTHDGGLIQGWQANAAGVLNTNAPVTSLKIPTGESIPAKATTNFNLTGNLPAWDGTGTAPTVTSTINAYDALGNPIAVSLTFTGVSGQANQWSVQGSVTPPGGTAQKLWSTPPTITFDPSSGAVKTISGVSANPDGSFSLPVGTMPTGYSFPSGDTWSLTFPAPTDPAAVTQFASQQTIQVSSQDGYAAGGLESFSIGSDGVITGSYSNGTTQSLGQLALASFTNPNGLTDQGGGLFLASTNSGQAQIGTPNTGGRGSLLGGELEQSNVNLGAELTNLINAQEAYDANTKVLTTSQSVIQALENVA